MSSMPLFISDNLILCPFHDIGATCRSLQDISRVNSTRLAPLLSISKLNHVHSTKDSVRLSANTAFLSHWWHRRPTCANSIRPDFFYIAGLEIHVLDVPQPGLLLAGERQLHQESCGGDCKHNARSQGASRSTVPPLPLPLSLPLSLSLFLSLSLSLPLP